MTARREGHSLAAGTLIVLAVAAPLASPVAWAQGTVQSSKERSGEQVVQIQCAKCHQTGVGGAPRLGDRKAWIPRMKPGLDSVVASAIRGHGKMPARGGMADLTDSELRNAIIYMFHTAVPPAKG
jgi:cytochrome c5